MCRMSTVCNSYPSRMKAFLGMAVDFLAAGPFDGGHGKLAKYNITSGVWINITPAQAISDGEYISINHSMACF